MRRFAITILTITLAIPGFAPRLTGTSWDQSHSPCSSGDHDPCLVSSGPGLAATPGPKTCPSHLLHGPGSFRLPLLSPPTSDGPAWLGTEWLPAASVRRHPWLQCFLC
ncbi:hypothetical protein [Tautonia plasticadhaerens]|uniref:Secreted protein n=1 Tax=Tautonia plasticadhaerens TaxID=2527974 RepID=A0A518HER7_9BACT|nr:hypothetical protein [Tautonia plasticadhaerens]QDV39331.1 hypothetical protein ElP_72960 [Tautonia plasticadhaerens]